MKEMVGGCCVCSDDRGWPENPLVYCDGQSCTVAVHQACYGIVTVPTGPWYCRKCESQERTARVKCELCPSKYGALKRTDNSGWAHVVCALYIPEVRFGNVTTMEPIQLQLIPAERFNKVCYICEEQGKASSASVGACMQCNKAGCKQQFHVTCAQSLGLLCEEAGNYLDNVKYCGYCQHHYSKLKKGGNVKTIPPYKPVSAENHLSDSNSEKEAEANAATLSNVKSSSSQPAPPGKRSKSSNSRTSSSSKSTSSSKGGSSSSTHQKAVHNNSSRSDKDKSKVTNSNAKSAKISEESPVLNSAEPVVDVKVEKNSAVSVVKDVKAELQPEIVKVEIKEVKISKRRKTNSRTPTPITVPTDFIPAANLSVLIPELSASVLSGIASGTTTIISSDKRDTIITSETSEKIKKIKIDPIHPPPTPTVLSAAPASVPSVVKSSPSPSPASTELASIPTAIISPSSNNPSIQSNTTLPLINSLVVSVPLLNTNLSPHSHIVSNQTSVVTAPPSFAHLPQERSNSERRTPNNLNTSATMTGASSSQKPGTITSEMSGGGLKITYEKQPAAGTTLRSELDRGTPEKTVPIKRSRSMSGEKLEKVSRAKKRNVNAIPSYNKRASRSQHTTPPPHSSSIIPPDEIKESPPSSPSSESQGIPPTRGSRSKGRKSAPAAVSSSSSTKDFKDTKDGLKVFQNGISAPHMLGNQLNPNSNMAQKMSDHLSSELEAHSIFSSSDQTALIGPQLHHRVLANARSSSTGGSSTASGASGFSMLGGSGGIIPQTLDQLLERQWEQGSQFLMEQAQHFDIASLLSCLHQLRAENTRLEEHVSSLLQRRDHLLAVNARLAIPLTGQPATPQGTHPHTVNNIHPSVVASHAEAPPRSRHGNYSSHSQVPSQHASVPVENGLPPDPNQVYSHHRSPAGNQSQSGSSMRHSPAGSTGYSSTGHVRQSGGDSGRTAPRPQPYSLYQGPGPSTAPTQMVIRRDPEMHHQPSSKPS